MTNTHATPHCPAGGYRHEAFFYAGPDAFLAGTLPFIRGAVEAGEPILVVLSAAKIARLRTALGAAAEHVVFADMAQVGTNPARIIPAWQAFLDEHAGPGRRLRGIGEPIWAGRSPAELAECERHEALLNVCFADPDFWLLCPYDVEALPDAVLEEARRNHPFVTASGDVGELSEIYPGAAAHAEPFDDPLPEPPADAQVAMIDIAPGGLRVVRNAVAANAHRAGLSDQDAGDLVVVVNELATNSLRHGGGRGALRVWEHHGAILCEVSDRGVLTDPLAGRVRPGPGAEGGRGLWMANQLCELVQVRSFADGNVVRVHKRLR